MPMRDGGSIIQADDDRKTRDSIAKVSKRDADAYFEFYDVDLAHLRHPRPHADGDAAARRLEEALAISGTSASWHGSCASQVDEQTVADITRLFTMSATDLLERWFESPEMKGFMAVNGIIGTWAGPDAPGTAYVLMHHSVGDIGDGQVAELGLHRGRHGRRLEGLRGVGEVLRRRGARERPGAHDHDLERTRAPASCSTTVRSCAAPIVVTACHPKITFLQQIDRNELPSELRARHRALEDAQRHREGEPRDRPAAHVHRRPRIRPRDPRRRDRTARRRRAARAGLSNRLGSARRPTRPFSDTEIPTVVDSTLAPEGIHTVSMFTQWCPADWADDEDDHTEELDAYADRLIDHMDEVAPGFRTACSPGRSSARSRCSRSGI